MIDEIVVRERDNNKEVTINERNMYEGKRESKAYQYGRWKGPLPSARLDLENLDITGKDFDIEGNFAHSWMGSG
jgi:hypothetical protein